MYWRGERCPKYHGDGGIKKLMSNEYDLYLQEHRANVKKGLIWLRENLPEVLKPAGKYSYLSWQIEMAHDSSKNDLEEYGPYDRYFYGKNRSYEVVNDFRYAWLRHIHLNPHHWQHWVLINDDPDEGEIVMDMPYNYIIEMICDWWAFSWKSENFTEIFKWYDEHKAYMKLSDRTRKTVEDILQKMSEVIEPELFHHGVKGQKWGVKNGPPYPLKDNGNHDNIVERAIESGEVKKEINREKQLRHTKSNHTPGRSYLDGDLEFAQELVDKYGGKGDPVIDGNGDWTHKEKIEDSNIIGTYVDDSKKETKTNKGMIVYSKTGSHVYPRKEEL